MKSLQDEYVELISLMKLYLLQEFSRDERLVTSPDSYEYYKNFATAQKKPAQPQSKMAPPQKNDAPVKKEAPVKKLEKKEILPPQSPPDVQPLPDVPKKVQLTPMAPITGLDLSDIKKKFIQNFPHHAVLDSIPEFEPIHKKTGEAIVIAFDDDPQHRTFLTNLTKAIDDSICSALLLDAAELEKNQTYPHLRLVVASERELMNHPFLSKWTKEMQQKNCSFVLLSTLSDYLASPKLKSQLWKQLKGYTRLNH